MLFRILFGAVMFVIAVIAGWQLKDVALDRAVSTAPTDWQRITTARVGGAATIFLVALMFLVKVISPEKGPWVQLAVIIALPGLLTQVYRRGIRDGRNHLNSEIHPEA